MYGPLCDDKKLPLVQFPSKKILISSLILPPKIPDVLITSWVRDLIIEFIGCISSAATESKTLGVEMLGAGNGGGGNTRGSK